LLLYTYIDTIPRKLLDLAYKRTRYSSRFISTIINYETGATNEPNGPNNSLFINNDTDTSFYLLDLSLLFTILPNGFRRIKLLEEIFPNRELLTN